MSEPVWKRLVESLDSRGFESRYLDRLMDRLGTHATQVAMGDGFQALQREMIEEMAYALRRAEDKVNLALLHCDLALEAIRENTDPTAEAALEASFNEHREKARRARWEFSVHREALGMRGHRILEELYPIPRLERPSVTAPAAKSE